MRARADLTMSGFLATVAPILLVGAGGPGKPSAPTDPGSNTLTSSVPSSMTGTCLPSSIQHS